MKEYDMIVIGSGAGSKLSTPAAVMGKKVAIIEKDKVGGTCLNRGCIPSKMLIHPANIVTHFKEAKKLGISAENITVDVNQLVSRVTGQVDGESQGIANSYEQSSTLDYYKDTASFVSDKVVKVGEEEITAPTIIISSGTRPQIPHIEGLEGTPYMTSTEALRNTDLPKRLLVIGGGYIACELGHAYAGFGSEVTFIVRSSLLKNEDEEVQQEFKRKFTELHDVQFGFSSLKVSHENGVFTLTKTMEDGSEVVHQAEGLLVATGVIPNSDITGIANTGIEMDKRGFIQVNEYLETAVPGVYALGDILGRNLFRHAANFEGDYLYGQLLGGMDKVPIVYPPMPHAVFTYPEIAGVGKTEQALKKEGVDYIKGVHPYKSSGQGMARLSDSGFVKLLVDKQSHKILGCHIIGDEASILVHQAIQAMTYDQTVDDVLNIIYIHPALPEVFRNACRRIVAQLAQ